MTLGIGQRVTVRLTEAVPVTGGIILELIEVEDRGLPAPTAKRKGARRPGPAPAKRKLVRRNRR
jgi:ribonuclease R